MESTDVHTIVFHTIRNLLACIFFYSFLGKLKNPIGFQKVVIEYNILPTPLIPFWIFFLLAMECMISLGLFFSIQIEFVSIAGILLTSLLSFVIFSKIRNGETDLACGCFGDFSSERISSKILFRNLLVLLFFLLLLFWKKPVFLKEEFQLWVVFLSTSLMLGYAIYLRRT